MTEKQVRYQRKTVQSLRGTERLSISKWQKQGWELVGQAPGKVRTTLHFRKPVSYTRWILAGGLFVSSLVVLGVGGLLGAFDDEEEIASTTAASPSSASVRATPSQTGPSVPTATATLSTTPAPASTATAQSTPADAEDPAAVISAETDEKFARLLRGNECNSALARFAGQNEGRTLEFDGGVADVASRGGGIYDVLVTPGNKGPMATAGPYFKLENVSMEDLNLDEPTRDRLETGDLLRVTAQVDEYDTTSCQFLIEPLATARRT